ncbi:MAG: hypothetical protein WDO68_30815 [Gammaproteobacteria bacterium]
MTISAWWRSLRETGRSRFTLSTLPAAEFPVVDEINALPFAVSPARRPMQGAKYDPHVHTQDNAALAGKLRTAVEGL